MHSGDENTFMPKQSDLGVDVSWLCQLQAHNWQVIFFKDVLLALLPKTNALPSTAPSLLQVIFFKYHNKKE